MKSATNKIGHGEGSDRQALNDQTRVDLKMHKADLAAGEKQIFGHALRPREWQAMNDVEKKKKSEDLLDIVKLRMEKRFKETGKF